MRKNFSKLFLFKHRLGIGYILLFISFVALLVLLPLITPNGLSDSEMQSSVTSFAISKENVLGGNIIDLPYHLLQKVTIKIFGLTTYGIKLPSIIVGFFLGLLLVLLLNRWFKNNVAITSSILTVLSASFLYIAGSGTPLIMFVFWPTLLLWLGSKIQGEKKPNPIFSFIFAIALMLSLFTPYMIYFAIFVCFYVLIHPHLRFTVKNLPKIPLVIVSLFIVASLGVMIYTAICNKHVFTSLLFTDNFSWQLFIQNLKNAFIPFFQWSGTVESEFLAPLIGLATIAIAITGLISTAHGFFASRNSIASIFIVFTVLVSGLSPKCAILLLLPVAILVAHGFKYIINKWYKLFPENPYAHIIGIIPIALFLSIMILSDIQHFIFGYRYNPAVANNFSEDLSLVQRNASEKDVLVVENDLEYEFFKVLEKGIPILTERPGITVVKEVPKNVSNQLITIGPLTSDNLKNYQLKRIVTNSKSSSSDRLYIYDIIKKK